MASHHDWWAYDSSNQYIDREELSSDPIDVKIHVPGISRSQSMWDKVRSACRSMGLDYSLSGDVVSVSGYPSSEGMDEDYVLEVFEGIHDGARIVS
ncbi:unnamed protein product [Sphagnum jensenii]|uniref:Uncharacterized protein n=1 Tax=Sphagnum jensenii TaxID=128206 RepID=A0ABP0W558_9BRYO